MKKRIKRKENGVEINVLKTKEWIAEWKSKENGERLLRELSEVLQLKETGGMCIARKNRVFKKD